MRFLVALVLILLLNDLRRSWRDVRGMPEYVFRHDRRPGGFFLLLQQYFFSRWQDARIPEYDLETDELVYRVGDGFRRERFVAAAAG